MADHVHATLDDLGPGKWVSIAQELQSYEIMSFWLRDDKILKTGGQGVKRNIMTKTAGAAGHHGLFHKDNVNIADLLAQISVHWVQADTYWAWEYREMLDNRGAARITNIIDPRRAGAMLDLAEELEEKAWTLRGATDSLSPNGIPYYVVQNATAGFNGAAPSGFTTVAGINPTTTTKWKNYTDTFAVLNRTDFLLKVKRMLRRLRWRSPITSKDMKMAENLRLYTVEDAVEQCETLAEGQNENLGNDLGSKAAGSGGGRGVRMEGDQVTIRRHPIIWVPELDEQTSNTPFYAIDHGTFKVYVRKGDYMRQSKAIRAPEQHNTFIQWTDLSYNFLCLNRRRNGVLYLA